MREEHLDHLLSAARGLSRNTWGEGFTEGIHNNWIRAARNSGRKFEIERKKNHPYIKFFREDSTYIGEIDPWKLPTCPISASRICASKIDTQYFLDNAGVSTPWSKLYEVDEIDKARKEAFESDKEVVIKAHNLSQAIGVFLHVDEEDFNRTYNECVSIQVNRKRRPRVIVQELMQGFELRCTVIEGELVDVLARIPAYVIGDGTSTIGELISAKNESRESDRFLKKRRIDPTELNLVAKLKADGRTLDTVPGDGESVLLTSISNVGHGGETANVTNLVSQEIKETAVNAVRAIPGLTTGGVDVMAETLDSKGPRVIEVNSFPHAYLSIYPTYGQSVNPLDMYLRAWLSRDDFENGVWRNWDQKDLEKLQRYYEFLASKAAIISNI